MKKRNKALCKNHSILVALKKRGCNPLEINACLSSPTPLSYFIAHHTKPPEIFTNYEALKNTFSYAPGIAKEIKEEKSVWHK